MSEWDCGSTHLVLGGEGLIQKIRGGAIKQLLLWGKGTLEAENEIGPDKQGLREGRGN